MQNLLIKYMEDRIQKEAAQKRPGIKPPPVITISREAGCSGNLVAANLVEKLNKKLTKNGIKWRVVNKEIIENAARDLELHPNKVKHIFKGEKKSLLDEMILSMSTKYYKSDWKIRKSISDVIRSIINDGYVVIVGRAGVSIAHDHPRAVHIKLQAPLNWRIQVISEKHNVNLKEAEKYIHEVDKSRQKLLKDFKCSKKDCVFDMFVNCERMNPDEIIDVIYQLMTVRDLV